MTEYNIKRREIEQYILSKWKESMNSPVPPINEGENGKLINQITAMRWGSKSLWNNINGKMSHSQVRVRSNFKTSSHSQYYNVKISGINQSITLLVYSNIKSVQPTE